MTEQDCLKRMLAPGDKRPCPGYGNGVIQIWVTRNCDKSCFHCTQGANFSGAPTAMTAEQFERACATLSDYFGVVGMFGGNPAMHPQFRLLCEIMADYIPFSRRGIWCNNPLGKAATMRTVFNPAVSNLNVHLDAKAYGEFHRDWPESRPFGLHEDSRHPPVYVALRDVVPDSGERWQLISECDINHRWSAMVGVFRGQLRAWFCEVAGAQSMLHQADPGYPDTGIEVKPGWWSRPIADFTEQIRKHCHDCGVPLKGRGLLAQATEGGEQVSQTHFFVCNPKMPGRGIELVEKIEQLGTGKVKLVTDYLGNAR